MTDHWRNPLIDRLIASSDRDGGWGYRPGQTPSAEPTALACTVLVKLAVDRRHWIGGLDWLAKIQQDDGGVPSVAQYPSPAWPTALALSAWLAAPAPIGDAFTKAGERAVAWLLQSKGRSFSRDPAAFGHDTTLTGWPWVLGTHSWVEPTAYAILALRGAGRGDHPRVREGVRLLTDRVLPDGGWNYGNTRVFQNVLRPFPGTTGIALRALAGESSAPGVDRSLEYLQRLLPRVRAPWSLGWGVVGLSAWNSCPEDASLWLDEAARRILSERLFNTLDAAILLHASMALTSETKSSLIGVP